MSEIIRPDFPLKSPLVKSGQFVERLCQSSGVASAFMRKFLWEVIAVVEDGLRRDGVVKIHNFGVFKLSWPEPKEGVDLFTGEKVMVSRRAQVIFQPAKNIRDLLNSSLPAIAAKPVSLQALIEKHIAPSSPPPVSGIEEPVPEEFDINEAIPAIVEDTEPAFVVAETLEEQKPVLALTKDERDRLRDASVRKRSSRFAWVAGSLAIFLLLLLFVFVGRISDQQVGTSPPVVSTAPSSTPIEKDNSFDGGLTTPTNGHTKTANGTIKPSSESPPFFAGATHRVAAGENLWGLSGAYYRDHYLWPNIYRVNTATITNPDILQIEQQLELPIQYGPPESLTPEDRRNVAEGYFLLYRYYKEAEPSLAPYALWAAVQYDAQIRIAHAPELSDDDLAFLKAHGVRQGLAEK
jgi:nucleoid DNA-binding protein